MSKIEHPLDSPEPLRLLHPDFTASTLRYAVRAKRRAQTKQQFIHLIQGEPIMKSLDNGHVIKRKLSYASPLVVGMTLLLATTASAAAVYWFNTDVTSSANGNIVSYSAKDCPSIPASQAKAVHINLPSLYSFDAKYEIKDTSKITEDKIKGALLATCEERAIAGNINEHFPDMQEFSAQDLEPNSKDLYSPVYASGVIQAVNGKEVVVGNLSSSPASAASATMTLADDALLTKGGQQITNLKPGDVVYLAYQNRVQAGETPRQNDLESLKKTTDPGALSVIRGLGVMTTDTSNIQALQDAISSGAVPSLRFVRQ